MTTPAEIPALDGGTPRPTPAADPRRRPARRRPAGHRSAPGRARLARRAPALHGRRGRCGRARRARCRLHPGRLRRAGRLRRRRARAPDRARRAPGALRASRRRQPPPRRVPAVRRDRRTSTASSAPRPCLDPSEAHGFVVDEAEVVFWGLCPACQGTRDGYPTHPPRGGAGRDRHLNSVRRRRTPASRVASDEHSLTVGPDGPILLQDHYLIEQMANFNRERIPERQPHAKGGGAFGTFEVTHDVSAYTRAAVFQPGAPHRRARSGSRPSPASAAAPTPGATRAASPLKFYTTEGNLDIVGNNTPVFFIRDPMKFQHFIRSQKRRADNNLRDHDMQWDFWTLSPESAHQVTWLMGDRGIPRTWRHMNGYSSHTYMWINAAGRAVLGEVPLQDRPGHRVLHPGRGRPDGRRSTPTTTSATCTSTSSAGEFPSWTLHMQIMPFEDAKTYRFNPFDLTKVWPHGDYPLHRGRPHDARTATSPTTTPRSSRPRSSRTTWCPAPGLSPGQDAAGPRVLLRRRAPRPARGQLPADPGERARRSPVHSYSKDGAMRDPQRSRDPVYAPNSYGGPAADTERYDRRRRHLARRRRDGAHRLHAARPRTTTGARPARWSARCWTTPPATGWSTTSSATCSTASASRSCSAPFEYWRNVDKDLGDRIEAGVRAKQDERTPRPRSRPTRPGRARRPRPDRAAGCPPPPRSPPRPRPRPPGRTAGALRLARHRHVSIRWAVREDDPLPVDVDRLKPDTFAGDVITKPAVSPLIAAARSPAASSSCAPSWGSPRRDAAVPAQGGQSVPLSGKVPATRTVSTAATTHGVRG